jgi:hypothetical protein
MAARDCSGRAGVVEMDVAEQQVSYVGEGETVLAEAALEREQRRGRAAIEQRDTVVGVDEVDADRLGLPAELEVEDFH